MPRTLIETEPRPATAPGGDLQEAMRAFGHDLREQLGLLSVCAELLRQRAGDSFGRDEQRLVSTTTAAVARARDLVADLMDFVRLSSAPPPAATVSSEEALDRALAALAAPLKAHEARVVREPLPPVRACAGHVQRIFEHLLDNAIKFRRTGPPRVSISCRRQGGLAEFQVGDNGIGIDPRYAHQAFRPLSRLHGHSYPGTGMGLTFCRRLVQMHGGTIWLEPSPGAGTIVFFTLPLAREEAA